MSRALTSESHIHKLSISACCVHKLCFNCRHTSNNHVLPVAPAATGNCHIFATRVAACKKSCLSALQVLSPLWHFLRPSVYFVLSPTSLESGCWPHIRLKRRGNSLLMQQLCPSAPRGLRAHRLTALPHGFTALKRCLVKEKKQTVMLLLC